MRKRRGKRNASGATRPKLCAGIDLDDRRQVIFCRKRVVAKGLCSTHYAKDIGARMWRRKNVTHGKGVVGKVRVAK